MTARIPNHSFYKWRNPYSQLLVSFQQSLISGRRSSVVFSVRRSLGNERIEPPRESDGMVIPIAESGGEPWSNVAQNVHTPGLHERRQCRVHKYIDISISIALCRAIVEGNECSMCRWTGYRYMPFRADRWCLRVQ